MIVCNTCRYASNKLSLSVSNVEKYKANDDLPLFVTMTFQGWVDLLTREVYRELFVYALKHCHNEKGLIIHEYVIMSNHAHLILQNWGGRLSEILRYL